MSAGADGYLYRPATLDQIRDVLKTARHLGRQVVLRGAGRSYGDAAQGPEFIVLDLTRFNRILSWDPAAGLIEAESGASLEDFWRHTLEDGWWLPVVSGTMYPTIGGALAMNVHGKNHFVAGTLAEHVTELDLLTVDGETRTLKQGEPLFNAVIGSAGLLGVITRAVLRMKRVTSGFLNVLAVSCRNWEEQFETFQKFENDHDYLVSWVDCFAKGKSAGRGQIHVAWYATEATPYAASLSLRNQELPDTLLGFIPKSFMWRILKPLNTRFGMRLINTAKYRASAFLHNGKMQSQSLAAFSFLLDYIPNWRYAYLPGGFIQYQCFAPKEVARDLFAKLVQMQQLVKMESFLGVMKRHRPDPYLLSYSLDGYSLAMDFKVTPKKWPALLSLAHRMNDEVLKSGGKFYFAKDSTMRPADVRQYLGEASLSKFRDYKHALDPENLLGSALAERLQLFSPKPSSQQDST